MSRAILIVAALVAIVFVLKRWKPISSSNVYAPRYYGSAMAATQPAQKQYGVTAQGLALLNSINGWGGGKSIGQRINAMIYANPIPGDVFTATDYGNNYGLR